MSEKKDGFLDKLSEIIAPEIMEQLRKGFEPEQKARKYQRAFRKSIESALDRYQLEIEIESSSVSQIIPKMLDPSQSREEMESGLSWYWEKYLLVDDRNLAETVRHYICETYLQKVEDEIENADIMSEIHNIKELLSKLQQSMAVPAAAIPQTPDTPQTHGIPNSTKVFRNLFCENLFWDKEICLKDVYIEPHAVGHEKTIAAIVRDLIESKTQNQLVIEGAPGVGKSSLMAELANIFTSVNCFFLRLSQLDFSESASMEEAFRRLTVTDENWKTYRTLGNILFLDGYDEIAGFISEEKFFAFMKKLNQDRVKVVVTSRPNYITSVGREMKIRMKPYDLPQIENWILCYLVHRNAENQEVVTYIEKINACKDDSKLMDVIGIPIFLYITVNQKIDISNIKSITQLYEMVFERLLTDKAITAQYEFAEKAAECLGFFMQAYMAVKYNGKQESRLVNLMHGNQLEENCKININRIFSNSFIRMVTEGTEELEFFHKSIQDYFAAKYIFMHLKELMIDAKTEPHALGASYASLLDKYLITEEIPHLDYFIAQMEEKERENLSARLKTFFLSAIDKGINHMQEEWFTDRFAGKEGLVTASGMAARIRYLTENHMLIMQEILHTSVVSQEAFNGSSVLPVVFQMALEDLVSVGDKETNCFFWSFFQYLKLNNNRFPLFCKENVVRFLTRGATIHHVEMDKYEIESYKSERLTFQLCDCKSQSLHIHNGYFYEITIRGFYADDMHLIGCRLWHALIENSEFHACVFEINLKNTHFTETEFIECTWRYDRSLENNIAHRQDKITFYACTFEDNVFGKSFRSIIRQKIVFENCDFLSCNFEKDTFPENVFVNCTFM